MNWIDVAPESEIPEGGCRVVWPQGKPEGPDRWRVLRIAIYRWEDRLHALDARCPHYGGPLEDRRILHGGIVECPIHWWRFELDTGRCENFPGQWVATYPVRVQEGRIQVQLVQIAQPVEE